MLRQDGSWHHSTLTAHPLSQTRAYKRQGMAFHYLAHSIYSYSQLLLRPSTDQVHGVPLLTSCLSSVSLGGRVSSQGQMWTVCMLWIWNAHFAFPSILCSSPDLPPCHHHPGKVQMGLRVLMLQLKTFTSSSWIWIIKPLHKSHQFPPTLPIRLRGW